MNIKLTDCPILIYYDFKAGLNVTQCMNRLRRSFGETISRPVIARWYQKFESGDEDLTRRPRPPKRSIPQHQLHQAISLNPQLTVQELVTMFNVTKKAIETGLREMGATQVNGKWTIYVYVDDSVFIDE